MVEDPGPELRFLTAGTFKQAVINDEGIDTISIRKGFNSICNFSGQEGRKTKPVDPGIVQEPVEGIFRKRLTEGSGFLLHVHAAIRKDIAQLIFEDIQYKGTPFSFWALHWRSSLPIPNVWKKEEIALKSSCPSLSCGRIEIGIETSCGVVVSGQFNYTKGTGIYAFYIAYIIEFSWFNTLLGVGSFSNKIIKMLERI